MLEKIWSGDVEGGLDSFQSLQKEIKLTDIGAKLPPPSAREIDEARNLLKNNNFGYTTRQVTKSDMAEYLETLQGKIPVTIEGTSLLNVEQYPYSGLIDNANRFADFERADLVKNNMLYEAVNYINSLIV
jgi:hypothetical protein